MKKISIALIIAICLIGCKYDDSYLDPRLETQAYFASAQSYTRTVIVGEGLHFRIGAAMAGVTENKQNETVDMIIAKDSDLGDKELMPDNYYNSSELNGTIKATIPAGSFLGYFTVKIDSINFLNDPKALTAGYALPVKITATSLQAVNGELDNVVVSVKYMCGVDGYYLYESVIKTEENGVIMEDKTITENYPNESDNSTWRLETQAPFKVKATSAVNASTSGLVFNIIVDGSTVTYESIAGNPEIIPNGVNQYNPKTRDFNLNYKYKSPAEPDVVYHVSQKLIFRNRMVDGVNQTRDYLSYFN